MWFFRRKGGRKRSRSGANFSDVEGQPPSRALTDGDLARTGSIKKQRTEPSNPRRARTYSFSPGRQDSIRVNQSKQRPGSNHGSRPQSSSKARDEGRQPTLHPKDRKSQRKRSSRIKREDTAREAELKAMTEFTPLRPAAESWTAGRPMKKDSRRQGPAHFRRQWDNPASDVSLPLPGSIHSSMSSDSEYGSYKVSAFDSLAPRPTLRYNNNQYHTATSRNTMPTRMGSGKRPLAERVNISDENLHSNRRKRIDELADDFDASDLRELMERDQRRRDRKRQRDQERVERRLARRAEKQREDEAEARKAGTPPPENLERGVMGREMVGLGIDPASAVVTSNKQRESSGERAPALAQDAVSNPLDHFHPVGTEAPDQSRNEDEVDVDKMSVQSPFHDDNQENAAAAESRERVGALPQTSMLSEMLRSRKTTSKSTLASDREKTISPQPSKQDDSPSQGTVDANGVARRFSLASFWRWTGKSRRVSQPSSFSNASREEMQAAAASSQTQLQSQANMSFGLGQAQAQARALAKLQGEEITPTSETGSSPHYIARKSSAPKRTRSRFREDLPDFPLSPPDSRVQSPEADTLPPLVEHGASSPETPAFPAPRDDTPHTNYSPIDIPRHKSSSFGGPSPEPHQSMSLASIGSEGSWLSGKTGSYRHSVLRNNIARAARHDHDNSSASPAVSTEDLGIADDEYMSRLTPRRHSGFQGLERRSGEGRPSSDEEPYNEDEELHWGAVDARVAQVHNPIRDTMHSREAQLNTNSEIDPEEDDASQSPQSPSSPTGEKANVERARSVNLGKGHVRNFSAGSAKLLDIHPRHSLDGKTALQERRGSAPLH